MPLEVLRTLRDLCANFRVPPRQFRRRTPGRSQGVYYRHSDIVAVNPEVADMNGMGGDDGYYVSLLHELLHATGHPSRLDRASCNAKPNRLEEEIVDVAQQIVLREIGFDEEAVRWHCLPFDVPQEHQAAAQEAAAWVLGPTKTETNETKEEEER